MARKSSTERRNPLQDAGLEPKPATMGTPPTQGDVLPLTTEGDTDEHREKIGGREPKSDDEKATEKVTAYFTPVQYDKIEELRHAHRKRAGKRISVNALLRRLVENAAVEDILP
jgi:hypothetical protein